MITTKVKTTQRGYRDITEQLGNGGIRIEKYDVIRGVTPIEEEKQFITCEDGQDVIYLFHEPEKSLAGRIFPFDEIIIPDVPCDIIVQKFKGKSSNCRYIDVNPYHDFETGEKFGIIVSQITERGDPAFKLYNRITGFVKDKKSFLGSTQIRLGAKLLIEVIALKRADNHEIVLVKPIESLEDL